MDLGAPRYLGEPRHRLLEPLSRFIGTIVWVTNMWLVVVALLFNSNSKKAIWNLKLKVNRSLMLAFKAV